MLSLLMTFISILFRLLLPLPLSPLLNGLEGLQVLSGCQSAFCDQDPSALVSLVEVPQVLEVCVEVGDVDEDAHGHANQGDAQQG